MNSSDYPDFLGLDIPPASFEEAGVHIMPAEMEKSVSFGRGAGKGPKAILNASLQLEAFDGKDVPGTIGMHTHPPIPCNGETAEEDIEAISSAIERVVRQGSVPIVLGGEHTVTLGALRPFMNNAERIGVVQFDAHADLRDTYEGSSLSHACVMRRVHEMGFPIMQIGIRSLSQQEDVFRRDRQIPSLEAETLYRGGIPDEVLPRDFPGTIYITFDVDCLDPSIMPATGTPEPGGLNWYQAVELLDRVAAGRKICGADVVELAPGPGMHAADFTAAKLVYTLVSIIHKNK